MSGLSDSSQIKETFEEKKARLLQELEELKEEEEELRREEEVRSLELQVEAARKRIREQQAEVVHKRARIASPSQEEQPQHLPSKEDASPAPNPEPGSGNTGAPECSTTAGHSHGYSSHAPGSSAMSASLSNMPTSNGCRPTMEARSADSLRKIGTLSYYTNLDAYDDNQVQSLEETSLDQLRDLAVKGEDAGGNVEQAELDSHVRYFIFLQTGAMDDLEKAIDRAKKQIPLSLDRLDYTTRLKDLIVMLIKKYERTSSLDDLQETIFRAQEMIAATPPEHPDRQSRMSDWIKMMIHKCGRTGLQDDLDETIITAREAGVEISMDKSDDGGALRLGIGIPT